MKIEGELTIYRASELCVALQAALLQPGDLEIDLSEVSEMDSAGVQLLMAAKRAAQASQRQLRLTAHSPAVLEVFETLDLAAHFGDPLVMAAQAA